MRNQLVIASAGVWCLIGGQCHAAELSRGVSSIDTSAPLTQAAARLNSVAKELVPHVSQRGKAPSPQNSVTPFDFRSQQTGDPPFDFPRGPTPQPKK